MFDDKIIKEVPAAEILNQQAHMIFMKEENQHAPEVSQLVTNIAS